VQPDDQYWRGQADTPASTPAQRPDPEYAGPPTMTPPPPAWQPQRIVEPAPPRRLPPQDHAAIDADEARARTLTYGVGILAGAVLVILLCALCGRLLF
jgi:hypothetical protein